VGAIVGRGRRRRLRELGPSDKLRGQLITNLRGWRRHAHPPVASLARVILSRGRAGFLYWVW
jgi:hypothetical protein